MTTHIAGKVTQLSSMWQIVRTDGVTYRFTDHARDITYGGNLYDATSGFSRSNIQSRTDMSPDNLDVAGILSNDAITDVDLRAGLFDFAEVRFFLVHWGDPDTFSDIKMRKGVLGEIKITGEDSYTAELRGLSQIFARRVLSVYSPECRVDLFSAECGLTAATFKEIGPVATVVDRQTFTVPQFYEHDLTPSASTSDDIQGIEVDASGGLSLSTEPAEDGTPLHPFIISTPQELEDIADDVTAHYALDQDLDMSGPGLFAVIPAFSGSLDGRGFKIIDINLDHSGTPQDAAIFATIKLGAVIKNLGIFNPTVRSGSSATWAAPLMAEGVPGNVGTIKNCYAVGGTVTTDGNEAGGLIGAVANLHTITNCWCAVTISGTVGAAVGGLGGTWGGALSSNNYFDEDVATTSALGTSGSGNNTANTTAAMMLEATYTGFDFQNIWRLALMSGDPDLTFDDTGNPDTIVRDAGSWLTEGFQANTYVSVDSASNDGVYFVSATPVALTLTLDVSEALAAEGPTSGHTVASYPRIMDPGRC